MLRIQRLKRPQNSEDLIPVDYLPGAYATDAQAEEAIERESQRYDQKDYNARQGYWWARNISDIDVTIFLIQSTT